MTYRILRGELQRRFSVFRFNNCHKRDHVKLYGKDAFFDLDIFGSQAKMLIGSVGNLKPGTSV